MSIRRSRGARERATALAVCLEEAQHSCLRRARAVPRWLWAVHALRKIIELATTLFPKV